MSTRLTALLTSAATTLVILGLFLGIRLCSNRTHRVVMELTSESPEVWAAALSNLENLQKAFAPETVRVELCIRGKSLGMLQTTNTAMSERLKELADSGVGFIACQNTMRRMNVPKEGLFPFVRVVESGIADVVRKQNEGWAYIKAGQ